MCADKPDVGNSIRVVELYDQSILVSRYVENDAVIINNARVAEHCLHIMRALPVRRLDLSVPGLEWLCGIPVMLPEIPQCSPLDYSHAWKLACSQSGNKVQIGGI